MKRPKKIHAGHICFALATWWDWFANTMMTEFDVNHGWADIVFVSRAGYLTEFEIKTSRADWNADQHKAKWGRLRPNVARFFYAVPAELAADIPSWVPSHIGVIAVHLNAAGIPVCKEVRPAKRMRAKPVPSATAAAHKKAYYRFWHAEMRRLHERFYEQRPTVELVA